MRTIKPTLVWMALAVFGAAVFPSSCTHKPYHATKHEKEWTIDHQACERSVRDVIREEPYTYDQFDEMRMIDACMKDQGWQWERTALFNFVKNPAE